MARRKKNKPTLEEKLEAVGKLKFAITPRTLTEEEWLEIIRNPDPLHTFTGEDILRIFGGSR